jgi:segregation and condensation protein B
VSPEDTTPDETARDEVVAPPEPPASGDPAEAAAELALEEALSGEPVTEDGDPVAPLSELAGGAAGPGEAVSGEPRDQDVPAAPDPVAAGDADDLPDLGSDEALEAALEALLLVVDSPASEDSLAGTLQQPRARIVVALRTMAQKFTDRRSGIDLRRVGEGWRFYTRDVYAPFVEKLLLDGQRSKLTRAALESLAVIAYRQPVTRSRVAAVRGVNVDGVIRTLLARGLIEEMGTDPDTTGTLYVTTELFLERLGLSSLNDLPAIAPLLPEVDTIDDIQ